VHRDIKPSNVFLCDAGGGDLFVKLLDFGIAKGPEVGIVGSTTRTGSFIGSPYYMSPEQVIGAKTIDFRTDLWSLGVVAFEALTGEKPFYAETVGALALKIHRDALPVPSRTCPSLPLAVDAWFARACAREPEGRYASAREMAEALALSVGEALAPGVQLDAVPAPSGGDGTVLSPASETFPSGVDARSETGGGVGLIASERVPTPARGRWVALAGIAVAAVGIGFVVPRLMTRPVAAAPSAAPLLDTMAAAPAPSPEPTSLPVSPVSLAPSFAPTAAPSASRVLPLAPAPAPHASAARPRASASSAAASVAPPSAAAPPHPPPGSDDDIK
ncbi:MAG TPA: serine/threonine-protein kinase, partial [Polyangiaceae bacterium]